MGPMQRYYLIHQLLTTSLSNLPTYPHSQCVVQKFQWHLQSTSFNVVKRFGPPNLQWLQMVVDRMVDNFQFLKIFFEIFNMSNRIPRQIPLHFWGFFCFKLYPWLIHSFVSRVSLRYSLVVLLPKIRRSPNAYLDHLLAFFYVGERMRAIISTTME